MDPCAEQAVSAETLQDRQVSPYPSTLAMDKATLESTSVSTEANSRLSLDVNASLQGRSGTAIASDSQSFKKSIRPNDDEDSPLSPPMAWSREGTNEELSRYQELQMRQQNEGQHRPQTQVFANLLADSTPSTSAGSEAGLVGALNSMDSNPTRTHLPTFQDPQMESLSSTSAPEKQRRSSRKSSSPEQPSNSQTDVSDRRREKTRSSSRPSSKTSRPKGTARTPNEGQYNSEDLSTSPASAVKSDHTASSLTSPHCRYRSSGSSGKKTRCTCSSCQQERLNTTSPQRSYRYGQYLGGSEPMPIYAGPLGLGDDIPSPTPSPPAPGRMSIHMAMGGCSPIGSPTGSPLLAMHHSTFLSVTTGPRSRPVRGNLQESPIGSTSLLIEDEGAVSSPPTSSHPIITGFQSQVRDLKPRSNKKSPSRAITQTELGATSISPSPSSPSSPSSSPYAPSSRGSTFQTETERDTSPSLSPFFSSKRSFSLPKQGSLSSAMSTFSTSPPMRADTLHTHNILQQSTSVTDSGSSAYGPKQSSTSGSTVSNTDYPRLAPPVVLVQSPTTESLVGLSEAASRIIQQDQAGDHSPLLYSSVLVSSTTTTATSSSATPSPASPASPNLSQPARSPSLQPLSPGTQHGAAATPPLSPSRKKEGHQQSTHSGFEKKEFESWSLNEQIQDRVVRTTPTLHYKSALLSGGTKDKIRHSQSSQIQQPKVYSHHKPSSTLAEQHRQQPSREQQNRSSASRTSQTKGASPIEPSTSGGQQQACGQSSARKSADWTLQKPTESQPGIRADDDKHSGSPGIVSDGTSSARRKPENNGAPVHVLRKSRSAPILASGQLSYADILKSSIKATSSPALPTSGLTSPISPASPEPTISRTSSSSPSPLISTSTSGTVSPTVSPTAGSSADGASFRSTLTMSLTPTRIMRSSKRLSALNSKSDNNLRANIDRNSMSAPMASLLSSLKPINAADITSASDGLSEPSPSESAEGSMDEVTKSSGSADVKHSTSDGEDASECNLLDEKAIQSESDTHATIVRDSVEIISSGLSFFRPCEELERILSIPGATALSQDAIPGFLSAPEQKGTPKKMRPLSDPGPAVVRLNLSIDMSMETLANASVGSASEESPSSSVCVDPGADKNDKESESAEAIELDDSLGSKYDRVKEDPGCSFQQELGLQEQDEDEQGPQREQVSGGLRSHRRRINSSGGKKLLLKKKGSHSSLNNSIQQQPEQQQQLRPQSENHGSEVDSSTDSSARKSSARKSSATPNDYVIPPFYFPMGKPVAATKRRQRVHSAVMKAKEIFVVTENGSIAEDGFVTITMQCCELPRYMNRALFRKVDLAGSGEVRFLEFECVWESLVETCPDEISMIFMILKQPNANVLTPTDFEVVLQDLILFHPGLEFLSGNAVFQERYLETVITRIFYDVNRRHGKMTLADLRRSSFDKTLWKLENSDLNQTEDCFSYKHFYVIYCKFWELDQDHDLILDEQDLAGYSGGAISTKVIRRVMQGYGNETGMFMVPDQEPLLEQQQQQTLLIQQQHQQQQQMAQNQLAEASVVEISGGIKNPISSGILDAEAGMVTVDLNEEEHHVLKRSETMTLSTIDMSSVTTEEVPTTVATTVSSLVFETAPSSVSTLSASESITILPQRSIPPGPGSQCHPQNYRMTYKGFIWFLLAETDKQTTTSIEYWFRCMDLDGDGILTVFELEQLFQEQAARMAILGMESFGFRDAVCQMQDLVSPKEIGLVRLSDLKQCGQAGPFIDLFCNVVRWRSFEAHQHQIRMRQQQIAMQRAADAAWEEVATGEDLFDDEDGDEGDDDFDDEDLDDDDDDDEDMEGEDEETDDLEDAENEGSTGSGSESAEPDDEDLLARNSELSEESSLSNTRMSMDPSRVNTTSTTVSAVKTETGVVSCVGIGLGVVIMNDVAQGLSQSLEQWRGGDISERSTATVKTLKRKRAKERRRKRRRAMMKRALLEEQRKEKALLATIRESPWIVYVESEYDKLVTIERPQSRTGWEEGEEDDEEEEEEEEMDDEEEEVMDEEDMLLEEGHNPAAAQQLQLQLLQQQQQQHQIQQMQMQMQQHHYRHQYHHHHHHHQHHHQHVVLAQIEAGIVDGQLLVEMDQMQVKGIAGGSVNACGQTVSRLSFEFGQDFEQIPVDSVGNEQTMAAARVAAGTNSL